MADCLFCRIIAGDIPSTKVFENDKVYAFRDINPMAPVHVLVVPKKHAANILEADGEMMADVAEGIRAVAAQEGIAADGFRVISNCGENGCQSVGHLHFHVLGGKKLTEKMG